MTLSRVELDMAGILDFIGYIQLHWQTGSGSFIFLLDLVLCRCASQFAAIAANRTRLFRSRSSGELGCHPPFQLSVSAVEHVLDVGQHLFEWQGLPGVCGDFLQVLSEVELCEEFLTCQS